MHGRSPRYGGLLTLLPNHLYQSRITSVNSKRLPWYYLQEPLVPFEPRLLAGALVEARWYYLIPRSREGRGAKLA